MKPRIVALATLLLLLAGCGSDGGSPEPAASPLSPAAQLGENIFKDESLSASGRMSCQTCHALATGHAGASSLPAELGGADLTLQSTRTAPSIRYLHFNGAFHFDDEDTPTGGFFWDGRAESLQAQAGEPFLNPREMALPTRAAVVERLRAAPYAGEFERVFGAGILADVERAYERMTFALAQYQREDAEFAAFDDAVGLTGLIVTKLDGTAKGGVLAAIAAERARQGKPLPFLFIGVGEGLADLQPFVAREFAGALVGSE